MPDAIPTTMALDCSSEHESFYVSRAAHPADGLFSDNSAALLRLEDLRREIAELESSGDDDAELNSLRAELRLRGP
jgi:hypothetical protein